MGVHLNINWVIIWNIQWVPGQYVRRSIPRRYASDCIEMLQGYVVDVWLYVFMYVLGVCLTERKRERDNEWLTVHVKISSLVESHFGDKERESECMFYTVIILSRACATKKGLKMTQIFVHLQSNRSVLIRIFTWLPREEGLLGTANTINGRESCFTFRLIFSVSV